MVSRVFLALLLLIPVLLLNGCWPSSGPANTAVQPIGLPSASVQVPLGKFFLIRHGDQYGAVKLTKPTETGDGGVAYTWYYREGGTGSFTDEMAASGEGEVFEKYRRVAGSIVEDDGGVLYIECGKLRVEWSLDNWIYLDTHGDPMEIALTYTGNIADIDYLHPAIRWQDAAALTQQSASVGAGE